MSKKSILKALGAVTAAVLLGFSSASAVPISPYFDTFGSLPEATFGGSGIPNDAVSISTYGDITLGLTAHQRYGNDPLTNDGAGNFFAQPGGDILDAAPSLAKWNVGIYADLDILTANGKYVRFFWDTNPASTNVLDQYTDPVPIAFQDSTNMGFSYFADHATNGMVFDPNATGIYTFALVLFEANGTELTRAEIKVNVGTPAAVPDNGASLGLLALGLFGLGLMKSRLGTPALARVRR